MPTKYIGRVGVQHGKTLYEIAANLKNLGVGRVVYRHTFAERYPEKSYYILTKDFTFGEAYGYKVFRGAKFPKPVRIDTGFRTDWKLVPKEDEEEFCKIDKVHTKHFDENCLEHKLPPLMEYIMKDHISRLDRKVDLPFKLKHRQRLTQTNIWHRYSCDIDDSFVLQQKENFGRTED
ncbi:hypothetical protein KUTeg_004323 [Tegillarca granosa]|uniref:28S ribosomal protein S34, mitochondrial n=1 Tax=Tegillarca granosa TaxID=220873 RepID=A0ABQ9FRD2_TEGGR|nr:hypothetical protein KUTeg_004323 [Tegillarca granosa]